MRQGDDGIVTNRRFPLAILWLLAFAMPALAAPAPQEEVPPPPPEEEDDAEEPRVWIIGAGGPSGSAITFNWNGPGRLDYGVYDHGCMNYSDEFRYLVNANPSLIGSVAPQAVTWETALATVRARVEKTGLDTKDAGAPLALAEPEAALAQLFAGVEQSPDDPERLFNLAGALSQNGLANEALAALARIRELGKLPALPLGVDALAALDYQAGYAEMLRGNLAAAKSKFQATIGRDPFINEAAHGLALIQAHEGNAAQGRQTYLDGMWRFKPKFLVLCGGQGSPDVRPPVDDMYDTSMGVEGKLVKFWHPDKASDLAPFFEMAGALATAANDRAEPLKQRMIAMGNNPRFADGTGDPYDAWADKMSQLIWSLDEDEPYVLQQQEKLERAIRTAERIASHNQGSVIERVVQLVMQPGNHCPTYRSLISNGIRGVLPHAERVEAEFREFARVLYKMATGLNSNIGDAQWFEYNDVALRAELESMNAGMLSMIMTYYHGFPAGIVQECPEEFVPIALAQEETPQGDECKEIFGNLKFKHTIAMPNGVPGPKFDVEVGCDKIKVDGKWNLVNAKAPGVGLELGGRASAEFVKGKGFTLFAGVGTDASAFGQSGSFKAGAFISGDVNGLTDLGGRTKLNRVDGTQETMDFGMMPKPDSAPRGPPLRSFRAPP